jgi:hypothetical protein
MSRRYTKDLVNKRIGKVTVLRIVPVSRVIIIRTGEEAKTPLSWVCHCDCGVEWEVPQSRITEHSPASCNNCADRTHKLKIPKSKNYIKKEHPSYNSWYSMIRRCTVPTYCYYKYYGARGITVTSEWYNFDKFVEDMGVRPEGTTIDRINNDDGYHKNNCRWATAKEQRLNQRRNNKK